MSETYNNVLARLSQQGNDLKNLRKREEKIEQNDLTEEVKDFRESGKEFGYKTYLLVLCIASSAAVGTRYAENSNNIGFVLYQLFFFILQYIPLRKDNTK